MVADIAVEDNLISGTGIGGGDIHPFRYSTNTGSIYKNLIGAALVDYFRVAGDDFHPGFLGGMLDRGQYLFQVGHGQAFFDDESQAEV